jgi:hypothetical protein
MDVRRRISRDQVALLNKGEKALVPPTKKLPADFSCCKIRGYIPAEMRALYTLIDIYDEQFKKTEAEADQIDLVALKAAVEYMWETRLRECCEKIRPRSGQQIEVLGDWSIVVITMMIK